MLKPVSVQDPNQEQNPEDSKGHEEAHRGESEFVATLGVKTWPEEAVRAKDGSVRNAWLSKGPAPSFVHGDQEAEAGEHAQADVDEPIYGL